MRSPVQGVTRTESHVVEGCISREPQRNRSIRLSSFSSSSWRGDTHDDNPPPSRPLFSFVSEPLGPLHPSCLCTIIPPTTLVHFLPSRLLAQSSSITSSQRCSTSRDSHHYPRSLRSLNCPRPLALLTDSISSHSLRSLEEMTYLLPHLTPNLTQPSFSILTFSFQSTISKHFDTLGVFYYQRVSRAERSEVRVITN